MLITWKPVAAGARRCLQRADIRAGCQVAAGVFVLLACVTSTAAWEALSWGEVDPVYSVVCLAFTMQPTAGGAARGAAQVGIGWLGGGVLGYASSWLVYACSGGWAGDTTKAALTVLSLCVAAFFLTLGRHRWPQYTAAFLSAAVAVVIVALANYWQAAVEVDILLLWCAQYGLGASSIVLATTLVLPVTAAAKTRGALRSGILGVSRVARGLIAALAGEALPAAKIPAAEGEPPHGVAEPRVEDGKPSAADGGSERAGGTSPAATGALGKLLPFIQEHGFPAAAALTQVIALQPATRFDLDAYRSPHLAPRRVLFSLLVLARGSLSTIMPLAYLGQDGAATAALGKLLPGLGRLGELLAEVYEGAGACLGGERRYEDALRSLAALEKELALRRWTFVEGVHGPASPRALLLGRASVDTQAEAGRDMHPVLLAEVTQAVILSLAHRARLLVLALPEGLHGAQAMAAAASARAAFLEQHPSSAALPLPVQPGAAAAQGPACGGGEAPAAEAREARVVAALRARTFVHHYRAARHSRNNHHIALGLQTALALAAAVVLHVCPASYHALGGHTSWVAVTVVVISQECVGGAAMRGANRAVGTIAGGAGGLAILYAVWLLNGLSFENCFGKAAAMTVLLSLGCGAVGVGFAGSQPHFAYGWTIFMLTLPIVALAGFTTESLSAVKIAAWRIVCILIGVALNMVTSLVVLPVTSRQVVRRLAVEALAREADLARLAPRRWEPQRGGEVVAVKALAPPPPEVAAAKAAPSLLSPPEGAVVIDMSAVDAANDAQAASAPVNGASVAAVAAGGGNGAVAAAPADGGRGGDSPFSKETGAALAGGDADTAAAGAAAAEGLALLDPGREEDLAGEAVTRGMAVVAQLAQIRSMAVVAGWQHGCLPRKNTALPPEDVMAVFVALRFALNSLIAFHFVLDGPQRPHLALLQPHAPRLSAVIDSLAASLEALGRALASGHGTQSAWATVAALRDDVRALLREVDAATPAPGCGREDVLWGHAAVGMLVSAVYTVQELYSTLGALFFRGADRDAAAALSEHPAWSEAWSQGWREAEVQREAEQKPAEAEAKAANADGIELEELPMQDHLSSNV